MGQTQQFAAEMKTLQEEFKAEQEKAKQEYQAELEKIKNANQASPVIKEVQDLSHKTFQEMFKRSEKYLADVETLYKETYGAQAGTKPVGTPEQPIAGGGKPLPK